jgi:hypothetical protein
MFIIVELLYGAWGKEGKEKRTIVNNIKIQYICAGRVYNNIY